MIALAAASAYLTRHCLAVANTTIQEDLNLDNAQMGWVLGAYSLGYLLCQVPGGWLGSRFGTRCSLPILSVLWSVCTVWTASVVSLSQMIASRFAFGLAQAGLVPNTAKVIKDWFPIGRRGFISSIITIAMSLGGALTMQLTAELLKYMHWRWVFLTFSLVGIVWAVVFYMVFRTLPRQHPWVNRAERTLIEGEIVPSNVPADSDAGELPAEQQYKPLETQSDRLGIGTMVVSISLWGICLQSFFRAAGYNFFVTFFPTFLEVGHHVVRDNAGAYSKWPLIGVIVGGLCGGLVVDAILRRTGSRWLSRNGVAIGAMGLTAAFTLASSWTSTAGGLVAVISVGAMFSGVAGPCGWVGTIDIGGRHTAVVVGVMNMAGGLSGVIVTPLLGQLIKSIKQTDGNWNLVIYLHAAFYLAAATSWLLVRPSKQIASSQE